jgi:hypothetical protein
MLFSTIVLERELFPLSSAAYCQASRVGKNGKLVCIASYHFATGSLIELLGVLFSRLVGVAIVVNNFTIGSST